MKKKLLRAALLIMCAGTVATCSFGQAKLGIHLGTTDYKGDLGNYFYDFRDPKAAGTISLFGTVSRSFEVGGHFQAGQVWFQGGKENANFKLDYYIADLVIKYKFDNGYILKEESVLAPYTFAGAGTAFMASDKDHPDPKITPNLNYGFGLDIKIFEPVSLVLQSSFNMPLNDGSDGVDAGRSRDMYLQNSIGFVFNFGKAKDADHDGVMDKNDRCPDTSPGSKVDANGCIFDIDKDGLADDQDKCPDQAGTKALSGCPDKDADGIADASDACPAEAGLAETKGCPDRDKDGVADKDDKCPEKTGSLSLNGCPDSDDDGVSDTEDLCPDLKGSASTKGCPDTDKDGINDNIDKCPTTAGPASAQGCPDTDKDGLNDGIDKCPALAGVAANQGCPELKKEVKQLFQKALQGIQFETGKAIIKPVSFPILNAIADVMTDNPSYKLLIGGHTDAVGDDEMNHTLSHNRASAVANYLIAAYINPMRISAKGYGESQPVDTNDTAAGRTRNRRVEFKVEFLQ